MTLLNYASMVPLSQLPRAYIDVCIYVKFFHDRPFSFTKKRKSNLKDFQLSKCLLIGLKLFLIS